MPPDPHAHASKGPIGGPDLAPVRALAEEVARAHGVAVTGVEWLAGRGSVVLRVTIERPLAHEPVAGAHAASGVTLEDCVHVSRDLSTALDASDAVPHAYQLEVSSPGLDRPLCGPADFRRQVGRLAKCKLVTPAADGQGALRGTIVAVDEAAVHMLVDGKEHRVPFDQIREAKLVFEIGGAPRPGGKKGAPAPKTTKGGARPRRG